jgi:hypothetical protein
MKKRFGEISEHKIGQAGEGEPHSIRNTSDTLPLQYVAFEFTEQDLSLSEMAIRLD